MAEPLSPVVRVDPARCVNCHACIAACPVKYCNDGSGEHVAVDPDTCIGCGDCVAACSHRARILVDDVEPFLRDLDAGVPIVAVVAPAVVASFPDTHERLVGWLADRGVARVFDGAFGAELAALGYRQRLADVPGRPVISSACPVVTAFIQIHRPELLPWLSPVEGPLVHAVRRIRAHEPELRDHRIALLTPCFAKRREFDAAAAGDYNVTFAALEDWLGRHGVRLEACAARAFDGPRAGGARSFSAPGGFARALAGDGLRIRELEGVERACAYLDELPRAIATGSAPDLVDLLACVGGCNGGLGGAGRGATFEDRERAVLARAAAADPRAPADDPRAYWIPGRGERPHADLGGNRTWLDTDPARVADAFARMLKRAPADVLNCTACGYGSCEAMAIAIAHGLNRPDNCHRYRETVAAEATERLRAAELEIRTHRDHLEDLVRARSSELLAANAELRRSRDDAETANQAKNRFLAQMGHEMRTPLNGILGLTGLALEMDLPAESRELVTLARGAGENLLAVVEEVLDYSRLEAGRCELAREPFDLRECLADALEPLGRLAGAKRLALVVRVGDTVPAAVVGDRGRLRQVLANLAGNAVKFTDQGKVVVEVDGLPRAKRGVPVRFRVADTGVGIPADTLASIFDPFVQGDSSLSRRFGGTGLGLSISSRLVRLMGGRIGVESAPGEGSTFEFTVEFELPAAAARPGDDLVRGLPARRSGPEAPGPAGSDVTEPLRILVAEDNPVNRKLVVGLLVREGHEVLVATNGREACERALERPDVILMDVQMPEMDGLAATRAIRAAERGSGSRVPIIALTAHAQPSDRACCEAAGMDAYLTKPICPELLRRAIADAVAERLPA